MSKLDKILYLADYIEPNRDFPDVEQLRSLAFEDLNKALMLGLRMTIEHLQRNGRAISPISMETLAYLQKEI